MRWRFLLVAALLFVMAAQQTKQDKSKTTKQKPDPKAKTTAKKDAPAADAKADRAKLQGVWEFTKLVSDGIEVAEAGITKMTITIKDDKLTRKDGEDEDEFTFALDVAKKPKFLDLTPTSDERKDKKQQGIYDVEGDTLKLGVASPGKARPKEFDSKPETDHEFLVLTRKK